MFCDEPCVHVQGHRRVRVAQLRLDILDRCSLGEQKGLGFSDATAPRPLFGPATGAPIRSVPVSWNNRCWLAAPMVWRCLR